MTGQNIEDIYPLSPVQQGMLFHTLLSPQSGVYSNQLSGEIGGALDVPAFQDAWQKAIDRQPVLRSAFLWEGLDEPLQVVRREVALPCQYLDWQQLASKEQETRMEDFLNEDLHRDFPLSEPPLMRLALMRVSADSYRFVWTHHHLLLDAWSLPLLLEEVFDHYAKLCRRQSTQREPASRYRDYIAWLREQDPARAQRHWRSVLQGFHTPTPLNIGRPGSENAAASAEQHLHLSKTLTNALQSLCRRHQLTLNTVVQGAWGLLLSCYSGEADVVFGSTVSSRPAALAGVESMIGLFINTIPVRVQTPPDAPLVPWLREIQASQTESRQYAYSSLADVQTWSDLPRGVPLFETLLIFENSPAGEASWNRGGPVAMRNLRCREQTNYPMSLVVGPGTQLSLKLMYAGARFAAEQAGRLLQHLASVLDQIAAGPDRRIGEIALLPESERRQVTKEWNATATTESATACIHELFEKQAGLTPAGVAVVFDERQLTYRELNQRANRLAGLLRECGVIPGSLVGISLERSLDLVVAVLAVLKAGGAYVPLDPLYPADRIAFMVEDSKLSVLLTQEDLRPRFGGIAARVICLSDDLPLASYGGANPVNSACPDDRAYVIYTSGSTGRPKGVEIPHRAMVNFLGSMRGAPGLGPEDALLAVTSLSFDIAGLELLLPLTTGARVVIASGSDISDASRLRTLLMSSQATVMQATPATWRMLFESGWTGDPRLKVLCGGEPMPAELAKALLKHCGALWNMYGPTETTVWSTIEQVVSLEGPIAIGRPIDNTQVYLLDACLHPVPLGVAGDLFIGGAGLARGYLARPDLTADRFIPDPFCEFPGGRLYKTGDVARYLPDGRIECLGRTDHQVKVRGFRIELAEIEAVLEQHPEVLAGVVVAHEFGSGDRRLAAYVVAHGDQTPEIGALRAHLSGKLPEYMVPSVFVFLPALPLTPNGKIDRRALPDPSASQPAQEGQSFTPRTPTEELIAGIWSQVLSIEPPAVEQNFFDLGGHSLTATQVISRLNLAFQVNLPIRDLFEARTVAALARRVEQARLGNVASLAPIQPASRDQKLPASFAQERMWLRDRGESDRGLHHTPLALRLTGDLQVESLQRALDEIVRRHESLRTTLSLDESRLVQTIHPHVPVALDEVDFSSLPASERETRVGEYARRENRLPFDLGEGPLFRVKLLRLAENEHILLLLLHHVVTDAWSTGVFLRELSELYLAFRTGKGSPLGDLPVQYADFAAWQQGWLAGEETGRQLSYWSKQLAAPLPPSPLPVDHPANSAGAGESALAPLALSDDLRRDLIALCQAEGATLFMLLLAAFQVFLHGCSGEEDLLVGSPVANRNRAEIEGLIGFFANTLMLRTDLSGDPDFLEVLARVRETTLDAYAHQDLPFEQVLATVLPGHDPARPPFAVWFTLEQEQQGILEWDGLRVSCLALAPEVEMVDLTLRLWQSESGIRGQFQYKKDLFDESTAGGLAAAFRNLLESIVRAPEQRLSELPRFAETVQGRT